MKTNKNGVKLLAAIMVFAMAFAGIVVIADGNSVDAVGTKTVHVSAEGDDSKNTGDEGSPFATITQALKTEDLKTIILDTDFTIKDVEIPRDVELNGNGKVLTVDGTITLNGILTLKEREIVAAEGFKGIVLSSTSVVNAYGGELLGKNTVTLGGDSVDAKVTSIVAEHGFTIVVNAGEITAKAGYMSVGGATEIIIGKDVEVTVDGPVTNSGTVTLNGTITVTEKGSLTMMDDGKFHSDSTGSVTIMAGGEYITGAKSEGSDTSTKIIGSDGMISFNGKDSSAVLTRNPIGTGTATEYGIQMELIGAEATSNALVIDEKDKLVVGEGSTLDVKTSTLVDGTLVAKAGSIVSVVKVSPDSDGTIVVYPDAKLTIDKDMLFGTDDDVNSWVVLADADENDGIEGNAVIGANKVDGKTVGFEVTLIGVAAVGNTVEIDATNKLIVDNKSTLFVKTGLQVDGKLVFDNEETDALGFVDMTKLRIGKNGVISNQSGAWTLTMSETDIVLTLNNYEGTQYFDGAFNKLVAVGDNTITIESDDAAVSAIKSSVDLTMSGGKLTVNYTNKYVNAEDAKKLKYPTAVAGGASITISGMELTVYANATSTVAKSGITHGIETVTTLNITDGSTVNVYAGNKALWVHTDLTIDKKSTVTAGAFEKAVRTGKTYTVAVTGGSVLNAIILDGEGVNENGVDDRFGIKTETVDVDKDSTVVTQGLRAVGDQTSVEGKVIVFGDYEQMITEESEVFIAGLAVASAEKLPVKEIAKDEDAIAGFNIREGTATVGNIALTPIGSDKPVSQDTINSAEVKTETIDGMQDIIITGTATVSDDGLEISQSQKLTVDPIVNLNDKKISVKDDAVLTIKATLNAINNTTITVTDEKGQVQKATFNNFKGTISVKVGSIVVDGAEMSGDIILVGENTVKLSGDIAGDVTISLAGGVNSGTVLILEDSTLTIPVGSKLILNNGIKMSNDGQIVGGGIIEVKDGAQFYTSTPVSVNFDGDGKIILEDAIEELELGKILGSVFETKPTQKVIATQNLTIGKDQYLVITGGLYIPAGVTITVADGGLLMLQGPTAYAEIDGTVKSLGTGKYNNKSYAGFTIKDDVTGDVVINGEIIAGKTVEDQTTVDIDGYAYLEGTITVNAKTIANFGDLEVSENGIVNVKGTITGELRNQGTVVIDGAVDNAIIYNQAVTAVVQIDELSSGTLTVSDAGFYLQTIDSARYYVEGYYASYTEKVKESYWASENAISFTNVEGITVTESVKFITDDDVRYTVNHMEIKGTVTVSDVKVADPKNPIMNITKGTVDVVETLDISKAQVMIDSEATLKVYGTVNVDDSDVPTEIKGAPTGIRVEGSLIVSGLVRCIDDAIDGSGYIEAVAYEIKEGIKTIYYYTNLADAIASGVKDLEVLGKLTILKDTTIPAGITIDASNKSVSVGDDEAGIIDVTLTVADGGYLYFGSVDVLGTFVIENTDDGVNKMTQITSDTSVITETTAMYTNLLNALNNAESGEVRITKVGEAPVVLSANATVKKDVTFIVPSSKALSIVNGVTLTVDGILKLDGKLIDQAALNDKDGSNGFNTQTVFAERPNMLYSVVKVNGTVISAYSLDYGGINEKFVTSGYHIPGAQYELKTKYYLTTIEQAAPVIKTVDNSTVKIYGENKVGTVAFEGTAMMPATVEIYGNITAESFTIAFGDIKIKDIAGITDDITVDGTFGSSVGSITVKNMKVVDMDLIITDTVVTIDDVEVQKTIVQGKVETNKTTSTSSLTFNGKVEISKNNFSVKAEYSKGYGNVTIAEDSTVTVSGTGNSLTVTGDKSKITVNGNLITTKGGSINTTTLVVMGTLDVKEAQGSIEAGLISVANLYIGGTTSDVAAVTTAGAAAVNAPATGIEVVYLFPGSTVTGILAVELESEDAVFTEFYVEDALWLTVYKISGTNTLKIAELKEDADKKKYISYNFKPLTLKEKEFTAWQFVSSGKLYNVAADKAVGDYSKVYADIKYDVYGITVYACEGIDDVFIDGNLMVYSQVIAGASDGGAIIGLYSASVVAGEHTISYTLTNGYSGTATMYIDDEKVTGYKFTAGGDFGDGVEYSIKLQGIEKSGYVPESPDTPAPTEPTEDEGLGITEYLLIVLVILAAILVVVVAIRMMRS